MAFMREKIYVVQYIVDDAPEGQIRGYSLQEDDFLLDQNQHRFVVSLTKLGTSMEELRTISPWA
ncbi:MULTISPECIES: hypothetical protein [unclassified Paenibacillus]|uniref:hypothetical protein n=1 Tax=unclassified Paenibacillus TaxID=185978 RepID=UPI00070FF991|nr:MULTISPECIES: hypothetical protein [unclassified Paenibacillus]KQX63006.1 hypothetical protein ASD40_29710 [Paenibacillus sp. Root444D2]KRE46709.1 hypothetical protein ASG85_29085 [Paenibacillus sp. Soil724D2]